MLGEYDAGLCLSQHHDLIGCGDIDAFVEQVNGENVIKLAVLQRLFHLLAFLRFAGSCQTCGPVWAFRLFVDDVGEFLCKDLGFLDSAAKYDAFDRFACLPVNTQFVDDVVDSVIGGQFVDVPPVCPPSGNRRGGSLGLS